MALFIAIHASAQQLTVKEFTPANQFISGNDRVTDWNDEPCALIKLQGASVDSVAGAFRVSKRSTETWVYMTDGSRRLTLFKNNYEPLTVMFDNYGVSSIKGNKAYLLKIVAPILNEQKWFFGIHGGINFSSASLGAGYTSSVGTKMGFNIGGTVSYRFNPWIGATTGLFYSAKGYNYSDLNHVNEECTQQAFDVPLLATVSIGLMEGFDVLLMAGPYASLVFGGKVTSENLWRDDQFTDAYSNFGYGIQGGLGVLLAKHYHLGASYQYGLSDYENRNISINLGYIF